MLKTLNGLVILAVQRWGRARLIHLLAQQHRSLQTSVQLNLPWRVQRLVRVLTRAQLSV